MKYFDVEFYANSNPNWSILAKIGWDRFFNDVVFQGSENSWCSPITLETDIVELYTWQNIQEWNIVKVRLYDDVNKINGDLVYVWYLAQVELIRENTKHRRYDTIKLEILHISFLLEQSIQDAFWTDRTLYNHVDFIYQNLNTQYPWLFNINVVDDYLDGNFTPIEFKLEDSKQSAKSYFDQLSNITEFIRFLSPIWDINFRAKEFQSNGDAWLLATEDLEGVSTEDLEDISIESWASWNATENYVINEWVSVQKLSQRVDGFYIKNKLLLRVWYESAGDKFPADYTFTDAISIGQYWEKQEYVDLFSSTSYPSLIAANDYAQKYAEDFFANNTKNATTITLNTNDTFFIYQLKVGDFISIINTELDITQVQVTNIEYSPDISKITVWRVFTAWKALLAQ